MTADRLRAHEQAGHIQALVNHPAYAAYLQPRWAEVQAAVVEKILHQAKTAEEAWDAIQRYRGMREVCEEMILIDHRAAARVAGIRSDPPPSEED